MGEHKLFTHVTELETASHKHHALTAMASESVQNRPVREQVIKVHRLRLFALQQDFGTT